MLAERRVGGGLGGLGLHFGRVRGSVVDCRSNIWRVRIEMKIPAEAGIVVAEAAKAGLQKPALGEGDDGVAGHDQVVEHSHVNQCQRVT